jgi:hypothetical protein
VKSHTEPAYLALVARQWWRLVWWWAGAGSLLSGFILLDAVNWPAWTLVALGAVSLLVAQWRAWEAMRVQRDEAHREIHTFRGSVKYGMAMEQFDLKILHGGGLMFLQGKLVFQSAADVHLAYRVEDCTIVVDGIITASTGAKPQALLRGGREATFFSPQVQFSLPFRAVYRGSVSYSAVYGPAGEPLETGEGVYRLVHTINWRLLQDGQVESRYHPNFVDGDGPHHEPYAATRL